VMASLFSNAVIYRLIEAYRPTLLIDEADTYLTGNKALTGILNSGHVRGGRVVISVKRGSDEWMPESFSTWGPKAIAAIGHLPETLADRSITISLHRRPMGHPLERFDSRQAAEFRSLQCKAIRWAADHEEELRCAEPQFPTAIANRSADNWRPLLAIADLAGASWPERARSAALTLQTDNEDEWSSSETLLWDLRSIFACAGNVHLQTLSILVDLRAMEERSWAHYNGVARPINAYDLASILRPYGIRPVKIRFANGSYQGYRYDQTLIEVFNRYAPPLRDPEQ